MNYGWSICILLAGDTSWDVHLSREISIKKKTNERIGILLKDRNASYLTIRSHERVPSIPRRAKLSGSLFGRSSIALERFPECNIYESPRMRKAGEKVARRETRMQSRHDKSRVNVSREIGLKLA